MDESHFIECLLEQLVKIDVCEKNQDGKYGLTSDGHLVFVTILLEIMVDDKITNDDILDYIDGTMQQMYSYGITETDNSMVELAKLVQLSVIEIEKAVNGIRTIKNPTQIEERCIEVNRLENIADNVLGRAIMDLFKTKDAITIIKLKDIYENLEIATDKCEDAANVLSDIAIRHT